MSADRRRFAWFPALFTAGLAVLATAGGCTICPDPFDYSGPVPNGSAPQNDFRARSNGILPLGAAPRPFPPVVDSAPVPAAPRPPDGDDRPVDAIVPVAAADAPPTAALPVVAEQDDVRDATPDIRDATPLDAVPVGAADLQPVSAAAPTALIETPGWRPRD